MKILIPTSITLDEEKLGLEPGDTVRHYNPTEPIAEEDTCLLYTLTLPTT